jgi:hypothetical protein
LLVLLLVSSSSFFPYLEIGLAWGPAVVN